MKRICIPLFATAAMLFPAVSWAGDHSSVRSDDCRMVRETYESREMRGYRYERAGYRYERAEAEPRKFLRWHDEKGRTRYSVGWAPGTPPTIMPKR